MTYLIFYLIYFIYFDFLFFKKFILILYIFKLVENDSSFSSKLPLLAIFKYQC